MGYVKFGGVTCLSLIISLLFSGCTAGDKGAPSSAAGPSNISVMEEVKTFLQSEDNVRALTAPSSLPSYSLTSGEATLIYGEDGAPSAVIIHTLNEVRTVRSRSIASRADGAVQIVVPIQFAGAFVSSFAQNSGGNPQTLTNLTVVGLWASSNLLVSAGVTMGAGSTPTPTPPAPTTEPSPAPSLGPSPISTPPAVSPGPSPSPSGLCPQGTTFNLATGVCDPIPGTSPPPAGAQLPDEWALDVVVTHFQATCQVQAVNISCGTDCDATYPLGQSVLVTATAPLGYEVIPSDPSMCVGTPTSRLCTFISFTAQTLTAQFECRDIPHLQVHVSGPGKVHVGGVTATEGSPQILLFPPAGTLTVTAEGEGFQNHEIGGMRIYDKSTVVGAGNGTTYVNTLFSPAGMGCLAGMDFNAIKGELTNNELTDCLASGKPCDECIKSHPNLCVQRNRYINPNTPGEIAESEPYYESSTLFHSCADGKSVQTIAPGGDPFFPGATQRTCVCADGFHLLKLNIVGKGTVTVTPDGGQPITCSVPDCPLISLKPGVSATVAAIPDAGWELSDFDAFRPVPATEKTLILSGELPGTHSQHTVYFAKPWKIELEIEGDGTVTDNNRLIDCKNEGGVTSGTCSATVLVPFVGLNATPRGPDPDMRVSWSGDGILKPGETAVDPDAPMFGLPPTPASPDGGGGPADSVILKRVDPNKVKAIFVKRLPIVKRFELLEDVGELKEPSMLAISCNPPNPGEKKEIPFEMEVFVPGDPVVPSVLVSHKLSNEEGGQNNVEMFVFTNPSLPGGVRVDYRIEQNKDNPRFIVWYLPLLGADMVVKDGGRQFTLNGYFKVVHNPLLERKVLDESKQPVALETNPIDIHASTTPLAGYKVTLRIKDSMADLDGEKALKDDVEHAEKLFYRIRAAKSTITPEDGCTQMKLLAEELAALVKKDPVVVFFGLKPEGQEERKLGSLTTTHGAVTQIAAAAGSIVSDLGLKCEIPASTYNTEPCDALGSSVYLKIFGQSTPGGPAFASQLDALNILLSGFRTPTECDQLLANFEPAKPAVVAAPASPTRNAILGRALVCYDYKLAQSTVMPGMPGMTGPEDPELKRKAEELRALGPFR